jgi:tetratricopeptide (TPR) repeat protein
MAFSINDQAVVSVYKNLSPEQKERFFPGQEAQAKKAVGSLISLLGTDKDYNQLLELYITVATRVLLGFENEQISIKINVRFSDIVPVEKTQKVIEFVRRLTSNYSFMQQQETPENQALLKFFDSQNEESFAENDRRSEDAVLFPDFGTDPSNPVFAYFTSGSYSYLNLLYTSDNVPLTWRRVGSLVVENSKDSIDRYELFLPDGTVYSTVFVNMYARKTSIYCPHGMVGDGLKKIPIETPEKKERQPDHAADSDEEDEYLAFLKKYNIQSTNTKTMESKKDEDPSQEGELLSEKHTSILQGNIPVLHEKTSIYKKENGEILAICSYLSISDISIQAMQVDVCCYDVWHEQTGIIEGVHYNDLNTTRDTSFGSEVVILLPDSNTRSIEITVQRVLFADGTLLQRSSDKEELPAPELLDTSLGSPELIREYRRLTYRNAKYVPVKVGAFWRCTCGAVNRDDEATCHKCRDESEKLFSALDTKRLQASIDETARLQREKEERDRIAREELEEARKARRLKEEEDERARIEKKRLQNKRIAIGGAVAAALSVVIYLVGWQWIPSAEYKKADQLVNSGDRQAAYEAFLELGKFRDSHDRACGIRYEDAEAALIAGDYDLAYELFTGISEYADSETQAKEAIYQKATGLMKNGEYVAAAELFESIPDHRQSKELETECRNEQAYIEATTLFEKGEYKQAAEGFEALDTFRDSRSQMRQAYYLYAKELIERGSLHEAYTVLSTKINIDGDSLEDSVELANAAEYQYAVDCFEAGSYIAAAESFANLNEYKDSTTRCLEAKYQHGLELFSNGEYVDAEKLFTELGTYKDSAKQANESKYQYALACLGANDYDNAIRAFSELGKYRDSAKQHNEARYQKATALMGQKKYQEAEKLFEELGKYSDSQKQRNEAKYQRALSCYKASDLKQAVILFKELGKYKDSVDQWKAAMYTYVLAHKNNNDRTTYEYLTELKKAKYQNSQSLYEDLYKWKVTLIAVNTDENDYSTILSSVSKTALYLQFWFKLDGGPPGETVTLTHKTYWPDGAVNTSKWVWENETRGSTFGVEWSKGLYDPKYAKTGELIIRIYIKSTNELIGQASVYLK